jgi:hypothetical protein
MTPANLNYQQWLMPPSRIFCHEKLKMRILQQRQPYHRHRQRQQRQQ